MKHGRPTISERKQIKELIFSYYENDIEAITTSKKTGINYKTILKYYKMWDGEIFESEKNDFLMRIKITKEKNILMLDNKIISLTREQKRLEIQLDSALQIGNIFNYEKLYGLNLKTTDQLLKIISLKTNLIGTPTADVIIQQKEEQNV
jgi:hypothetical protein